MLHETHQKLLNDLYPDGYKIKTVEMLDGTVIDEHNYYHVLFVKIIPNKNSIENTVHAMVQKFGSKDWAQAKKAIEEKGMAITQYNQYGVIHDPVAWKEEKAAKKNEVKSEPKPKPGPKPKAQKST